METIALKYRDGLFIEADTILEHQRIIDELGYVWYGKLGRAISHKNKEKILSMQKPKILLMNSGTSIVYWAYVSDIVCETAHFSMSPVFVITDKKDKGSDSDGCSNN